MIHTNTDYNRIKCVFLSTCFMVYNIVRAKDFSPLLTILFAPTIFYANPARQMMMFTSKMTMLPQHMAM